MEEKNTTNASNKHKSNIVYYIANAIVLCVLFLSIAQCTMKSDELRSKYELQELQLKYNSGVNK